MTETSGARPVNVTTGDLSNDEYDRLTPAQLDKLSTVADAGDLPVSHLSPAYNEPASINYVDPAAGSDPAAPEGDGELYVEDESPDEFEGNGDDDRSLILPDADPDGADTGPMPAL